MLLAFAGVVLWVRTRTTFAEMQVGVGLQALVRTWDPRIFASEVLRPQALLALLGLLVLVEQAWRRPSALLRPLPSAALVLLLACLPFSFALFIQERGGYYLSLVPVLAVAVGFRLRAASRATLLALFLACIPQAWLAWSEVQRWEHRYPGHEWAEPLFAEAGERAVVVTIDTREWEALARHSRLTVLGPRPGPRRIDVTNPATLALAELAIARSAGAGPVVLMRGLLESEEEVHRAFVRRLVERYGPVRPGARPEWALLGGPAEPPSDG